MSEIRTHTWWFLRPLPLPLGYHPFKCSSRGGIWTPDLQRVKMALSPTELLGNVKFVFLMGGEGLEPTCPAGSGFTGRRANQLLKPPIRCNRDDRNWTCNHSLPKRPFYQIELHPEVLVAGIGFEPMTFRLWAWRATTALPRDARNFYASTRTRTRNSWLQISSFTN